MTHLQRKQAALAAWHLSEPADMVAALTELTTQGWRGGLTSDPWRLELNADEPTRQITASLGDWLVDDMGLRLLTAAEVTDNYDEVP